LRVDAVATATLSAAARQPATGANMLSTILVIVLILLLIGAIPSWPYSRGWGYGPSGLLGIILIVVLILALTGNV
jgi:hypothetical protein